MDENNYKTPEAELITETNEQEMMHLASRWKRLGASIIDSIVMMLVLIPVFFVTGMFELLSQGTELSFGQDAILGLFGIVIFLVINLKWLINDGQTVGKKVLSIRIVTKEGERIESSHIWKRYAVYLLPNQVPFIGGLFSFINILFIFGAEKRCIHDLVADTKVIDCV